MLTKNEILIKSVIKVSLYEFELGLIISIPDTTNILIIAFKIDTPTVIAIGKPIKTN